MRDQLAFIRCFRYCLDAATASAFLKSIRSIALARGNAQFVAELAHYCEAPDSATTRTAGMVDRSSPLACIVLQLSKESPLAVV